MQRPCGIKSRYTSDREGTQLEHREAERNERYGVGRVHHADPRPARGVLTSTQEQHQGLGAKIGFKGSVWSMKQVGILQRSLWLPVGCR